MAEIHGRLGAIYAPTGTGDLSSVTFAQIGSTTDYVIQTAATRILRAFTEAAEIADFTPASGTITALKRPAGVVTFASAPGATVAITSANSRIYTLAQVGGFTDWTLNLNQELIDTTTFGAEDRQFKNVLRGWDASAERFWIDENMTVDVGALMQSIDAPFAISCFVDTTGANLYRWVGFANIEGVDIATPTGGLVGETIRFRGHKNIYYRDAGT